MAVKGLLSRYWVVGNMPLTHSTAEGMRANKFSHLLGQPLPQ